MLAEEDIRLYTDHRTLLFVFNPLALDPELGRHTVNNVQRWGQCVSKFSQIVEHIPGRRM